MKEGPSDGRQVAEPLEDDDPYAELEKESVLGKEEALEKENNSAKTNA